MLFRCCFWAVVLTAGALLVTGCSAPRGSGGGGRSRSGSASASEKPPPADAISEQALIEAHAHYAAGVVHDASGESELALNEYFEAAVKDPTNEALLLEVSRRLLQAKQPEKAVELLTRATQHPGAPGPVFARLGFVYSQMGKYDLAAEANRNAIRRAPRSLSGHQNLYLNELQNKHPAEALKALDEAAKVPNTDAEFLVGLAELYANFGLQVPAEKKSAHTKALAVLRRAEKLQPEDVLLRLRLADGFSLLGDDVKAAQIYSSLVDKLSVPFVRQTMRAKLASIYLRTEDHKRATEQLEAILQEDPTNVEAYYLLGCIAYDGKTYDRAAEHLSKAILLNPNDDRAYWVLAEAQMNQNKNHEALATLEQARKRFPASFLLEYSTGVAYSRAKAYREALNHFTAAEIVAKATEPDRLTHLFYFQVGATSERKGDYEGAEKAFEKCLALAPDFADAQNYLGYMWAERGEKLERAHELIEKAVKAEPKNAAFLDSLGWVLFKLNKPKEALPHLLKAVEFSEEPDATVFDHLGDIYAALGQTEKAREAWRKSLSIEASEPVRKKLEPPAP